MALKPEGERTNDDIGFGRRQRAPEPFFEPTTRPGARVRQPDPGGFSNETTREETGL